MKFTGERLIPDDPDHQDLYYEHLARYRLASSMAKGKRVLDLACGSGYGADLVVRSGAKQVVGIDISAEAIDYANSHYSKKNLNFETADALLNREDFVAAFDLIIALEVLEHLNDQSRLLENISSWLAPGGTVIISTPNPDVQSGNSATNPFHVKELSKIEFQDLLQSHFEKINLLGQRRLEGICFSQENSNQNPLQLKPLEKAKEKSPDYFIALCGEHDDIPAEIFEIPFYQDMDRLRIHLDEQNRQIDQKNIRVKELQKEITDHTRWAQSLDQKVELLEQDKQDQEVHIANLERLLHEAKRSVGFRIEQKLKNIFRGLLQTGKVIFAFSKWFLSFFLLITWLPFYILFSIPGAIRTIIATPMILISFLLLVVTRKKVQKGSPESLDSPNGVSIIIPSWNGQKLLEKNLPNLTNTTENLPFACEILIVDGASTDGTEDFIRKNYPAIRFVSLDSNRGFAANANAGAEHARYDLIYFINNDMKVTSGFLQPIFESFKDKHLFAAASNIFPENGKERIESGLTRVFQNWGLSDIRHLDIETTEPKAAFYAGGGASAYCKELFSALGGFDESYKPFYAEDLDLSWRAAKAGYKIIWHPNSHVIHEHRGTIGKMFDRQKADNILSANILQASWRNLNDISFISKCTLGLFPEIFSGKVSFEILFTLMKRMPVILSNRIGEKTPLLSDREVCLRQYQTIKGKYKKLKILILSPYCPWPPNHGGAVRIFHLWKNIAKDHEVHLLAFAEKEDELAHEKQLTKHFASAKLLLKRPPDSGRLFDPNSVLEFGQSQFALEVDRLIEENSINLVCSEYPNLAHLLPKGRAVKTAITQIDILSHTQMRRVKQAASLSEKAEALYESLRLFRYEKNYGRKADLVLTMSRNEKHFLLQNFGIESAVSPNGVDAQTIRYAKAASSRRILFVGNFRHSPNTDAVLWFEKNVYPLIREQDRTIRWTIAGPNPPAEVARLSQDPSISVCGYVSNLIELYHQCGCVVAPITRGSGTRLKILEAMAAGCPVVSTTIGVEGIEAEIDKDLLVVDKPENFAHKVRMILDDHDLANNLSINARKLIERKYDWEILAKDHARLLQKLVEGES